LRGWVLLIYAVGIRVNLSSTPHPQPLSHAGERGARGENPIPLLSCNKSEASSVLPTLVGGNEGGGEGVRG